MINQALLWRVLRLVRDLETPHYWPPLTLLCARLGAGWEEIRGAVLAMADRGWDTDDRGNGHPWVSYNRQARTVSVTADGLGALEAARRRPLIHAEKWNKWIDERRWPTRERPLERVAIPTGGTVRGSGRCPEAAALIDLARQHECSVERVTSMIMDGKLKTCPRCKRVCKVGDFGPRKRGGLRSWCRSCEAAQKREKQR